MILNAIVAADRTNGIGNTKRENVAVSLPWKLGKEFEYFLGLWPRYFCEILAVLKVKYNLLGNLKKACAII